MKITVDVPEHIAKDIFPGFFGERVGLATALPKLEEQARNKRHCSTAERRFIHRLRQAYDFIRTPGAHRDAMTHDLNDPTLEVRDSEVRTLNGFVESLLDWSAIIKAERARPKIK